jgi:hypothetical protein
VRRSASRDKFSTASAITNRLNVLFDVSHPHSTRYKSIEASSMRRSCGRRRSRTCDKEKTVTNIFTSEPAVPPSSRPAEAELIRPWQPPPSSALEWEQAKAACRERIRAESALRFHLRIALQRFAQLVGRMADRLRK